jgi:hypothetical protein
VLGLRVSGVRISGVRTSGVRISGFWKNGFDGVGGEGLALAAAIGFRVIEPIDRDGASEIPRPFEPKSPSDNVLTGD